MTKIKPAMLNNVSWLRVILALLGQWGSGTWYPLDVAPGDETEHIIAQACKMARKTSTQMQIMCYEKK